MESRWIRWPVQLLVVGLVVWLLVVPKVVASRTSLHLLFDVDSQWIAIATGAELASLVGFALATRALLARRTRPAAHQVLRIDLSTIALSHCLPGGSAAGTALGIRLLTRAGVPVADASFTKIAQGLGSALVLQALLVVALLLRVLLGSRSGWAVWPLVAEIALVVAGFSTATMVQLVRKRRRHSLGAPPTQTSPRLRRLRARLDHGVRVLGAQLTSLQRDPRRLSTATSWVVTNWLFDAAALWAALRAYGHPLPVDGVLLAFALANTLAWLPFSPSGLGLSDALLVPALIALGAGRADAVLGVITWRLLSFWLPIPLGLASYGSLRVQSRRVSRRAAHAQIHPS
ncbi:MAG TPA: YbhN family protein [Mycobacteriales bacterium]|nr:YbhN family protein [Mycobacteriales bacterium]